MGEAFITSNPAVMLGKPVIAGTRITVELIVERLAAGKSVEQLLAAYPRLTQEGIATAVAYAEGHEISRLASPEYLAWLEDDENWTVYETGPDADGACGESVPEPPGTA